jgi:hypothetical protein
MSRKEMNCAKLRRYENFWADENGILYRQGLGEQLCAVNTAMLVYGVSKLG